MFATSGKSLFSAFTTGQQSAFNFGPKKEKEPEAAKPEEENESSGDEDAEPKNESPITVLKTNDDNKLF